MIASVMLCRRNVSYRLRANICCQEPLKVISLHKPALQSLTNHNPVQPGADLHNSFSKLGAKTM